MTYRIPANLTSWEEVVLEGYNKKQWELRHVLGIDPAVHPAFPHQVGQVNHSLQRTLQEKDQQDDLMPKCSSTLLDF